MPWSMSEVPPSAKNLSDRQKEIFVRVANSVLEDTGDEERAIRMGMATAKEQTEKSFMDKTKLVEAFSEFLEKHFGGSEKDEEPSMEVTKAVDDEQRMAMFVVLEPDTYDAHNDIYSPEEVWKACNNFNTHCMKANLFHRIETEDMKFVQSFISPSDFSLDDGRTIKKGTWLAWTHFPETEAGELLWKGVKSGELNGLSIQGRAFVEEVEE